MLIGLRLGSKRRSSGSILIGDWFLPLLQTDQGMCTRPQKSGPGDNDGVEDDYDGGDDDGTKKSINKEYNYEKNSK